VFPAQGLRVVDNSTHVLPWLRKPQNQLGSQKSLGRTETPSPRLIYEKQKQKTIKFGISESSCWLGDTCVLRRKWSPIAMEGAYRFSGVCGQVLRMGQPLGAGIKILYPPVGVLCCIFVHFKLTSSSLITCKRSRKSLRATRNSRVSRDGTDRIMTNWCDVSPA
jgi:hypothetical protein